MDSVQHDVRILGFDGAQTEQAIDGIEWRRMVVLSLGSPYIC